MEKTYLSEQVHGHVLLCPRCGETINSTTLRCPHCDYEFEGIENDKVLQNFIAQVSSANWWNKANVIDGYRPSSSIKHVSNCIYYITPYINSGRTGRAYYRMFLFCIEKIKHEYAKDTERIHELELLESSFTRKIRHGLYSQICVALVVFVVLCATFFSCLTTWNATMCSKCVNSALAHNNYSKASSYLTRYRNSKETIYVEYINTIKCAIRSNDIDVAIHLCSQFGLAHNREFVLMPLYEYYLEQEEFDRAFKFLPIPNNYATKFGTEPTENDVYQHMLGCVRIMCAKGEKKKASTWVKHNINIYAGNYSQAEINDMSNKLYHYINNY